MSSPWQTQFPERLGDMPMGGGLFRTDPAGPPAARVLLLGVYPEATEWQHPLVKGQPTKVPTAVERTSFEATTKTGQDLDKLYLGPLGLARGEVLLADLWPYFMVDTRNNSGRPSLAANVEAYEKAAGTKTAVAPRPSANELLTRVRTAPGSIERLQSLFEGKPRLVITLGNEPAAFVRGLAKAADAQPLLYGEPAELTVEALGVTATFLHLTHPGNGKPEWREKHAAWCAGVGPAQVRAVLER